ncbi:tetratricopeptide repeat protein [Stella sp.]|uniref:tetratricopeptide repeat protein n=1 Tax=Stella sp. TaxID=2912054 RepID=UPI0035B4C64D
MMRTDDRGLCVSGADRPAVEQFETALSRLLCGNGDPEPACAAALARCPEFAMARTLAAYVQLCGSAAAGAARAAAMLPELRQAARTDRERQHVEVIAAYSAGDFDDAAERLDDILLEHPRDLLALHQGHLLDFYRGDQRNLRDRVARVRHAWSPALPGHHSVLAMHAFGLEECGDYGQAEDLGREALAIEPGDTWAHHAVAHVMEMQGRRREGIQWMRDREPQWAPDGGSAVHNWWHLALFLLDGDRSDEALALYDRRVAPGAGVLDLVDASALLWRLALREIDCGDRWKLLAQLWAPFVCDGWYAFNDVHAMMAFVGAGRWELAEQLLATMRHRLGRPGGNRAMTEEVGLPLARALADFGRRDFGAAIALLRPLRSRAQRFGGSHAQRDLVDLTLLEAARRDGQASLLRALAHERLAARGESPLVRRYLERAADLRGAA